jgi:hypothetical protein
MKYNDKYLEGMMKLLKTMGGARRLICWGY